MTRRASEEGIGKPEQEETRGAAFGLPRPGPALTALTTSALALPGIAGSARADAPIERATSSASFSYYKEDKLSPSRFESSVGSRERYEVYTGQARFDIPTSKRTDLGIGLLYEEMSGASPWYVVADTTPGSGGKPLQVMSGATIEDRRFDLNVDLDFYMDSGKDTLSGGVSLEKDYRSLSFGIGTERNFNDKNTTLSLSGAASFDEIFPTDPELSTARPAAGEVERRRLRGPLPDPDPRLDDRAHGQLQALRRLPERPLQGDHRRRLDGHLLRPAPRHEGAGELPAPLPPPHRADHGLDPRRLPLLCR